MKIKATQLCRCGHEAAAHTIGVFDPILGTRIAPLEMVQKKRIAAHKCASRCETFELPNLDLIEYLAEKRGLI